MQIIGLTPPQKRAAEEIVSACIRSRSFFIKEILEAEPEDWQYEVLEAMDEGNNKISIRSGHGVGKTALCSWVALHFLLFRDDVKIIVTAPSADQMRDGLIPEINKWISKLPDWMKASLDVLSDRITRSPNNSNNFISFRTARKEKPEALAGVHAEHVMIIVDEASGVDEVIYETGQGALSTEGAIALLIGNPTNPTGFFFKTQTVLSDVWWTKKVACQDSSRVSEQYIISQMRTYGVDSREYRVRVLGEFPDSGSDSVIPRAFAESAINRYDYELTKGIVWGLDPGRGGDPTGFIERDSNAVTEATELKYVDLMQTAGWVKNRWDNTPIRYRPDSIFVDSIGLGAGVADRLLEMGLPVIHVNVAEAPAQSDRFQNLRAELWYQCREWFEKKECTLNAPQNTLKLVEELVAVNQKYTSLGKVQIESKDEMKRRGLKSPNLADALIITFAHSFSIGLGNYKSQWGSYDPANYRMPNVI